MGKIFSLLAARSDLTEVVTKHNDLVYRDSGAANYGQQILWTQFDGAQPDVHPPHGAAVTGLFSLVLRSTAAGGLHRATLLSATLPTAAPTAANSVELVQDAGLFIGAGKKLRLYDAAGTDYAQLGSDADGGLVVDGSGASAGSMALAGKLTVGSATLQTDRLAVVQGANTTADGIKFTPAAPGTNWVAFYVGGDNAGYYQTQSGAYLAVGGGTAPPSLLVQGPAGLTGNALTLTVTGVGTVGQVSAAGALTLGLNAATTGQMRIPNNTGLFSRNAANSANFNLIGANGSDQVLVGDTANTALTAVQSSTDVRLTVGGSTILTALAASVTIAPALVNIGTTPATAGAIRLPNAQQMYFRNAANTGNVHAIGVDGSDIIGVGQAGNVLSLLGTVVAPTTDPPTRNDQVTANSQVKAYAYVTGGGGATLGDNYNITSIVRNAAGDFTLTFDRDFAAATYAVVVTPQDNGAFLVPRVNGQAAGSCDIHFYTPAGVATDPDAFGVACFGTLS